VVDRVEELGPRYLGEFEGLQVQVGGQAQVFSEVGHTIERDILRAEAIAIPITIVLLVLVFGSAVARQPAAAHRRAVDPRHVPGAAAAGRRHRRVHLLGQPGDLAGLGLGIDYALFMVNRHREELRAGRRSPRGDHG
jgi:RND superfamily putative drug exporter